MKYTTVENIENFILTEVDISFEEQVESWIEVVSQYINNYTGRVFIADTVATERLYQGKTTYELFIDDAISVTKVEVDDGYDGDSYTEETDYKLLPFNYAALGVPITRIKRSEGWHGGIHKITGKWGYSVAVPDDIAHAATILTVGIMNRGRKIGKIKSESIGNYQVSYEDDKEGLDEALDILNRYKKIVI